MPAGRNLMRASVRSLVLAALACCPVLLASLSVTGCSRKQAEPQHAATPAPSTDPAAAAAGDEPLPPLRSRRRCRKACASASMNPSRATSTKWWSVGHPRRRGVQPHALFRRPGGAAGRCLRVRQAHGGRAQQAAQDRHLKVIFWFVPLPRDRTVAGARGRQGGHCDRPAHG